MAIETYNPEIKSQPGIPNSIVEQNFFCAVEGTNHFTEVLMGRIKGLGGQ